jgi:hypothetical protein
MQVAIFWVSALMSEAVSTSETSVNLYLTTRRNILEDSHLHSNMLLACMTVLCSLCWNIQETIVRHTHGHTQTCQKPKPIFSPKIIKWAQNDNGVKPTY